MDERRENISSLDLERAMRFFSVLSEYPFVALVAESDGYHLFTKGSDEKVEELLEMMKHG